MRTNRGLSLTETGQSFYRDAARLSEQLEAAIARARQLSLTRRDVVRIGNSLLNPCKPLLDLWNALEDKPDCTLRIVPFVDTVETLDKVYHSLGAEIDVLIGACDIAGYSDFLQIYNLGTYSLCIGVPRRHPLADRARLSPEDLRGERLILLREGEAGRWTVSAEGCGVPILKLFWWIRLGTMTMTYSTAASRRARCF